ncbi:sensor histidine kinase [Paenibacillaceae bacterium]|nr:sensor histidine kinase [Paenibacillaceae bacterium]
MSRHKILHAGAIAIVVLIASLLAQTIPVQAVPLHIAPSFPASEQAIALDAVPSLPVGEQAIALDAVPSLPVGEQAIPLDAVPSLPAGEQTVPLLATSLRQSPLQATPKQTEAYEIKADAAKITWDAYYYGDVAEGEIPNNWLPFSLLDSDHEGDRSGRDLWLKADLPERREGQQQLLIYYQMIKNYEISLYVENERIFTSASLLPAGFISWRMVTYESGGNQVLLAQLSPHENFNKGFEVWSGTGAALTLKLLRSEALVWAGALIMALFSIVSLIFYLGNRSQALFIYFAVFFASLAIDLAVLWGGWQFAFPAERLMLWGSLIHFNWYIGHASGILITHAIVGEKGQTWIRNVGFAVMIYGIAAFVGWLMLGEQTQLLFYLAFYDYISTCLLLILAVVLLRALKQRRDTEIKVFAVGNVLFVGGLVFDRAISGQLGLLPQAHTPLTSQHALAQISWSMIGFACAVCCLCIIMNMRLVQMAQLRTANRVLRKVNVELQVANDKLAHIDEIRSNMYSEVSHELNTPITAIKGYVQLMLNGTIPAGETRYLQVIHDKSLVMERMIDDMLEIARLENRHIQFEYELVPISAYLARLCHKVNLDMADHGFAFKWRLPPEQPLPEHVAVIYADPMRVEQVIINLLSNARKFTRAGGLIQLEAVINGQGTITQSVIIRVIDSGCGIGEDEQEAIFDRYYRGRAAKADGIAGTGLGLPICREIMHAHQGEIGLEGSSPAGSTFFIKFPLRFVQAEELERGETP